MLSIKEINLLQAQNEGLKKQNAELQKENTKLKTCLQDIKAIVCGNYEIIDPQGRKDILKLIIKAENERLKEENVKLLFGKGTLVEFCNKLTQIIDKKKESENKLLQTLQEIKKIALLGTNVYKEEKEPNSLSTWKNAQFEKILNLITKAESEG